MKINFLKSIIFSVILAIVCSCVNNDDYTDEISPIKTYELVSNKLVAQVSASTTTNIPVLYTSEDIIEAYVTSNDESGNFFSTICFQTFPVAGSIPTSS